MKLATFFIDVEAGDGAQSACVEMIPPDGWTVELCDGFDVNGHGLYKFTGGTPLQQGDELLGRLIIDTNGLLEMENPLTGVTVPPLSVILHAAQEQEESEGMPFPCDLTVFGPEFEGGWSTRRTASAFLPVPSMSTRAKVALAMVLVGGGVLLVLRSRRPAAA